MNNLSVKKTLLVDTNLASKPIYDYLNEQSFDVYVCGNNPNDYLAKVCGRNHINIDYTDINRLKVVIDSIGIDYVVPGCNDLSYQIVSLLAEDKRFLGADSASVSDTLNDKEKFRIFAMENGFPVPVLLDGLSVEKGSYPVIVKPVDAYSGRGVTVIDQPNASLLSKAVETAMNFSSSGNYVIEEYVQGQLYSHSAFLKKGEIVTDFVVEEYGVASEFAVDTSRVVYGFPERMLDEIRRHIQSIAKKLQLVDGLFHTQFIKEKDKFWIIEVTRRSPGSLYSLLIEYSTDFKYAENYVRPFLGLEIQEADEEELKKKFIMQHTIYKKEEGFFDSISMMKNCKVAEFFPLSLSGDNVRKVPSGRVATIFFSTESEKDLDRLVCHTVHDKLYKLN